MSFINIETEANIQMLSIGGKKMHTLSSNSRITNWATNSVTAGIGLAAKGKNRRPIKNTNQQMYNHKKTMQQCRLNDLNLIY